MNRIAERILIVEDEVSVAEAVAYTLEKDGFEPAVVDNGRDALQTFMEWEPQLVILDLMLPGISGWELFSAFRRMGNVPVIMLTARIEEPDRVAGLEMGADDYVTKPFSMRELVARVRAVLRRSAGVDGGDAPSTISRAGVVLDAERRKVTIAGNAVELPPKQFDLLKYLMENAGLVRTRSDILRAVWGEDEYVDERTVDVHVRWVRQKIELDPGNPARLLTVRGVGYKFAEGS